MNANQPEEGPRATVVREGGRIPEALAAALREARRVVVLTGAGVSAESGVPTFRDAQAGLWRDFDPMQFASEEGYELEPRRVWEWYEWRRGVVAAAQPNPAHLALARLEALVPQLTLITQNVDDLHERAGSRRVLHLHGHLFENRCFRERRVLADADLRRDTLPPRCPCGAYARPGVVWFGEALPREILLAAEAEASRCDLCLVVGTSAVVHPAAGLIHLAPARAVRVVANIEETEDAEVADFVLLAPAGQALPALVDAAFGPV